MIGLTIGNRKFFSWLKGFQRKSLIFITTYRDGLENENYERKYSL